MALIIGRQSVSLRDAKGHVGRVQYLYQHDTTSAAFGAAAIAVEGINAAIAALSNGSIVDVGGLASARYSPLNYGTNAEFPNAEDKARLVYLFGDSAAAPAEFALSAIEIPAPKVSLFYNDGETVNGAVAGILALNTLLAGIDGSGGRVVTKSGLVYVNFAGGYRRRRRAQRKITLYTLSANLDEPEE